MVKKNLPFDTHYLAMFYRSWVLNVARRAPFFCRVMLRVLTCVFMFFFFFQFSKKILTNKLSSFKSRLVLKVQDTDVVESHLSSSSSGTFCWHSCTGP